LSPQGGHGPGVGDLPEGTPFLSKPYTPAALISLVRELLDEADKPIVIPQPEPLTEAQGSPVLPAGLKTDQLHTGIGHAGGLAQPLPVPDE
jgi:hypothetical protein